MKVSDRVRRRRRRRTSGSETEVPRRPIDDDEPPAIGADPDRVSSTSSRSSSIQPVLDSFAREWDAARRGQSTHLPANLPDRVFGPRNDRIACMAWLKGTFLPDVAGGDPDLATEIFRAFCQRVVRGEQGWAYRPNPAKGTWSIWQHLSPRAEQARQLVVRDGWKSADELAAQETAEQERQALVEQVRDRRDRQVPLAEAYLADLDGSVRFVTIAENGRPELREFHFLDEAQTCDYQGWVDVDVDPLLGRLSFADWKIRQR